MQIPANLLPELLLTARYAARSLLLSQAAGGNNSVKDIARDLLWVKASGVRLAALTESYGTVALRTSDVRNIVRNCNSEGQSRSERHEDSIRRTCMAALDSNQGRPSLETGFHALLGKVVLHLHPVYLNAFTCMEDGRHLMNEVAPRSFAWVEYGTPGQELAVKVDTLIDERQLRSEPICLVLENHGFIASGQTAAEVIQATDDFVHAGQSVFGAFSPELFTPQPRSADVEHAATLLRSFVRERWDEQNFFIRPARFGAFDEFASNPNLWNTPGALVPDDVVFTGKEIRVSKLAALRDVLGPFEDSAPEKLAVAVEGIGTVLLARNQPLVTAMEETLLAHVLVRILIARRGRVRPLPLEEINYLENMESEKYRIMLRAKGSV